MITYREINGIRMACWLSSATFDGKRSPLVFVHGSGGDHTVWVHQYAKLKNDFDIAALELPGHGASGGQGEQDVPAYVAWVKRILEAYEIRKPILIGHSLGAAICLTFAITYPDLLAGIVPVGGGVKMPVNQAILEGLKKDRTPVIDMIVKFSLTKNSRERLSGPLRDSMMKTDPVLLHDDLVACDRLDVAETIRRIKMPTLVVCGADDKMTPPDLSRFIAGHIPGAKLVLIEDAGHFVMMENVEAFNRTIGEFSAAVSLLP